MANIIIKVPDERLPDVCDAVAQVYHVTADRKGLKEHFLQHLRETIMEVRRRQAALGTAAPFVWEWGDLSKDDTEAE